MRDAPYLVAEIGQNHNGDVNIAKKLALVAKETGWSCVKLQKRTPSVCIPEHMRGTTRDTPWGLLSYEDYRERLELSEAEYREFDAYCRDIGIQWTASVWDSRSVDFIDRFDVPYIKIPSACLARRDILHAVKRTCRRVRFSVGMHEEIDINRAAQLFPGSTILHTVSSYPAEMQELQLHYIGYLRSQYPQHRIGYSGHELGIAMSLTAWVLGADVIERHVTLDRSMWGTDQAASLEPGGMLRLARDIRSAREAIGTPPRVVTVREAEKRKTLVMPSA
jgi:N-acetylneuraminate synthase